MKISSIQSKIIITIIIFAIFYTVFTIYSDIEKIKEAYQHIKLIYLIPILGITLFSMFLRSLIQRSFLNAIGIKLSIKQNLLIFIAGLSMLITPGGSGQVIKSHFIERKYGHPVSKSLPLVFAERFFDFLAITLIISATIFLFYSLISLIIVIISSVILGVIFIAVKNEKIRYSIKTIMEKIPFIKKRSSQLSLFNESLGKLFEIRLVARTSIYVVLIFSIEGLIIYLCFLTFNIDLGYLQTIQTFYTSVLFGTLSFIPTGVGILEGTFTKLMIQKHLEIGTITSLLIFIRLTTTWYITGIGFIVSYFILFKKNSSNYLNNPIIWEFSRICLDLFFGIYRKRFQKFGQWNILSENGSVIDIGCGIGQYSKITKGKYLGVDLESGYINYCKKKYRESNKSFRCADAASILKENSKFDMVLMSDFLHHISDELAIQILKTSSQLANQYVVCFEPISEQNNMIGQWIINHDRGDHIRTLNKLHELIEKSNLEIIDSAEIIQGPLRSRAILAKPKKTNTI